MDGILASIRRAIGESTKEEVGEADAKIRKGAVPNKDFFVMAALSTIIATYGLLTNNVAVIIGAMLVAPLMTPLLAIALGIVTNDRVLILKSIEAEAKGVLLTVAIATFITLFSPQTLMTPEIMSRVSPTIFDLLIALAAGMAGAYALSRKGISESLVGVAMATSLMPPLAVVGIGIAMKSPAVAVGSALLFAANAVAICFIASIVFFVIGFARENGKADRKEIFGRITTIGAMMLLIAVPLGYIMLNLLHSSETTELIGEVLDSQISGWPNSEVVSYGFERKDAGVTVDAVIRTTRNVTQGDADEMRAALEKKLGRTVALDLEIIGIDSFTSAGPARTA